MSSVFRDSRATRSPVKCSLKRRLKMFTTTGAVTGASRKPVGGFCLVHGTVLLSAWAGYRRGDLRLMDLRVWFACLELVARRCVVSRGVEPLYRIDELHRLVGGIGGKHLRHAIARLEKSGLLRWGESFITIAKPIDVACDEDLHRSIALVANHGRLVPIPRRIVRLIAGGARRVAIATIFGHLLRCLYYRRGVCLPEGTCKASWIADVFGVDVRNVKSARKQLVACGWLVPIPTRQTLLNRFGQRVRVNLEWSGNDISAGSKLSPRSGISSTGSPPPYKDKKLSSRIYMNQKPANGPSGVSKQPARDKGPMLRHVVLNDLHDSRRLAELHRQAVAASMISRSECDRLRFFAAAEHAKALGRRNPCGLFSTLVRRGLWKYVTHADENAAMVRLKEFQLCLSSGDTRGIPRGRDRAGRCTSRERACPGHHAVEAEPLLIRSLVAKSLGHAMAYSG